MTISLSGLQFNNEGDMRHMTTKETMNTEQEYEVTFEATIGSSVTVTASNVEEATAKARKEFLTWDSDDLPEVWPSDFTLVGVRRF